MRIALACVLLATAATTGAGTRDDYGYAWTLELQPGSGAHRLVLPGEVYARINDPQLRDLEVFNAQGAPVPFGPVPRDSGTVGAAPVESRASLPWFALRPEPAGADAAVSVQVERDAEGRLRRIQTDLAVPEEDGSAATDFLLDASALREAIDELELSWDTAQGQEVNARFEVLGSEDYEIWRTLVPQASVIDLRQGDFRLTRRTIDLPGSTARYLRLVRLDPGAPLAVGAVVAVLRTATAQGSPELERVWSDAAFVREEDQRAGYVFRAVGPIPAERAILRLASPNSVSRLTLQSRDEDAAGWSTHGELTAFRIEAGGTMLEHDPLALGVTRDRQWRVVADPPLDAPPTLRLGYRPDEFAVLEQGPAPYTLAVGSASARRQEYPMAALLGAMRAELGRGWEISRAGLVVPVTLRGDAAFVPPEPPKPVKLWALWGVLVVGVLAVLWMVMRLLKSPPPSDTP